MKKIETFDLQIKSIFEKMELTNKDTSSLSDRIQENSVKLIDVKKEVLEAVKETNRAFLQDFQDLKQKVAGVNDLTEDCFKTCELVDEKVNLVKLSLEKNDRKTNINYSEIRSVQNNKVGLGEFEDLKKEFDKKFLDTNHLIKSLDSKLLEEKF